MSNESKRKRTNFTARQKWNRFSYLQKAWNQTVSDIFNKLLTEAWKPGSTASTGAEDVER